MATEATKPTTSGGVLEEFESSPALMLALLGQEATRRLRDALDAHDLKPRQYHVLGLLHDHGPMGQRELGEALFAGLDEGQLRQLRSALDALRHNLARSREKACEPPNTAEGC